MYLSNLQKKTKYQIFKNCLKVGSAKFGDIFVGDYILTSETLIPLWYLCDIFVADSVGVF